MIDYIALPPCIRRACFLCSCAITILVGVFCRVYSFARVFLQPIARSATRPLRSSFSLRHCPSSLPMILIYFLRTKFSQFCCRTHDASVARKGNNIRFNFEISTHIKLKKHLFTNDIYSIFFTKFSGQTCVVGDLLSALN